MANKSLYDLLGVKSDATPEAIQTAYEKLRTTLETIAAKPGPAADGARRRLDAVKEAWVVLGNADRRAEYDWRREAGRRRSPEFREQRQYGLLPVLFAIALSGAAAGLGGYRYGEHVAAQRHASDKEMIEAKALEHAAATRLLSEQSRAERERVRLELMQQREARITDEQLRERDRMLGNFASEQRASLQQSETAKRREEQEQRRREELRRREEQQTAHAAREQLARDKAELCRIERERYGRPISC